MNIVLTGKFPKGTKELFVKLLPASDFSVRAIDTEEEYAKLTDAEVIVLRIFKISREVIERNKNLKLIEKWGAGYDTIDIEAAGNAGVPVCNVPGANAYAVSDMAVLHMLAVMRNLIKHHENMLKGTWTKNEFMDTSYSLMNKTVGLIGLGNIGKQVVKKVQAFGAQTIYFDVNRLKPEEEDSLQIKYVPMNELLKSADIVSLHTPLTESTRNMIGKNEFALMKPTAIIVNTGRGGLIDEDALIEAINNKQILGAGLDCFREEPISPENPLLKQENIVMTPHIGGTSAELMEIMIPIMVKNIIALKKGQELEAIVNNQYLEKYYKNLQTQVAKNV